MHYYTAATLSDAAVLGLHSDNDKALSPYTPDNNTFPETSLSFSKISHIQRFQECKTVQDRIQRRNKDLIAKQLLLKTKKTQRILINISSNSTNK